MTSYQISLKLLISPFPNQPKKQTIKKTPQNQPVPCFFYHPWSPKLPQATKVVVKAIEIVEFDLG